MPKPTPPVRPAAQPQKPQTTTATPASTKPRSNTAPIKLSSGDAKLMAAVLMEMMKR
ncbi:hypothetical protein [Allochromatium palmeri]|uniref:Uncharacterized protein n=1 Tax=Allochromatium palmeri TaxID=231048 RepID=A0A6N8EBQ0_9GAMM|nr:hypothetical protein [Allochromatium palmeri]MTW20016.1 hypothetical protein [Allochromatium palmeri]